MNNDNEMSQKEREMVERCIALSEQIRLKSDELADLLEQHTLAWEALWKRFGDHPYIGLQNKPYIDFLSSFGEYFQEICWLRDAVYSERILPSKDKG
jgi:hypothetical protein